MQQLFNSLYAALIGLLYDRKPVDFGLYKTEIFNSVGLYTLLTAAALMLVFYYIFNHAISLGTWYRPQHWLLMLLLAAGLGALLAFQVSMGLGAIRGPYLRYFIIVNTVVAPLWFVLFSLVFKRWSNHARTTPF